MDFWSEVAEESHYRTPYFNSTLFPLLLLSLSLEKNSPRTKNYVRDEYDYIIIGGGSAGSTLAGRLAEVPFISVLLLEAGKAPPKVTDVPAFAWSFYGSDVDWNFTTEPQKFAGTAYRGCRIRYPRGKMLGGSSNFNGNQYVRGNRLDYDLWEAEGAEGWSFDDVLPYFRKMEGNRVPKLIADKKYHGAYGPITVSQPVYVSELASPLYHAYRELGLLLEDINGPKQTGAFIIQETIRDGQRCGTAKAYLVPQENAPNLDIVTNAFVTKIVIENQRATSVIFRFEEENYELKAKREIILSAGSINTPKLLMLSGIGPTEHLVKHKIPVVVDLPVGLNLQDHCLVIVPFEIDSNIKSISEKLKDEIYLREYIKFRTGPLTFNNLDLIGSFLNKDFSPKDLDYPSIKILFVEASATSLQGQLVEEVYNQVYAPYENKTIASCITQILNPVTRGSVQLRSADPYDPPVIDLQYLKEAPDMDHTVDAMNLCQRIITSKAMQKVNSKPFVTKFPECESMADDQNSYFRCVATLTASTGHHQVGTAKMGSPDDPTTVVDQELRVKNVKNLRVVDASIMPRIIRGNTNAPTIMIAEKAADLIKDTYFADYQINTK